MSLYLLSQCFATVGFAFGLYGFMHAQDKRLKLCIAAAAVSMAVHFALLGAMAGVFMSLLGAARYIASSYTRSTTLMGLFMAIGIVYGATTHQVWSDAIPVVANILGTYAIFNLTRARLRGCLIGVSICWITYNGIHHSIVGVAMEVFYILANLYNIHKNTRTPVAYKA